MGLRCSLLGHDFADAELDREREERGDEVVITIREVQTCRRCGSEQVLSENTEVRPVEPIDDVQDGASDAPETETAPTGETVEAGTADEGPGGAAAAEADDATFIDADAETADAAGTTPEVTEGGAFDAAEEADPATDAESDDGVILDEDESDEPGERHAGEWPDAEDTRVNERDVPAEAGPEVEAGEAADAAASEDAEILDGEDSAGERAAAEGGADAGEPDSTEPARTASDWPDPEGDDEGFDAEPGSEQTEVEFSGIAPEGEETAAAETTPAESPSLAVGSDTAFVCPSCGFSKPASRSSLRAGDICPECKKGYLREE